MRRNSEEFVSFALDKGCDVLGGRAAFSDPETANWFAGECKKKGFGVDVIHSLTGSYAGWDVFETLPKNWFVTLIEMRGN